MQNVQANFPAIEVEVRSYLLKSFLTDLPAESFRNDDDLLLLLDSLQLLRMVMHLEAVFHFKVENSELTPENLGTVERVARFVADKERQRAEPIA